jgi:hypothetical protein
VALVSCSEQDGGGGVGVGGDDDHDDHDESEKSSAAVALAGGVGKNGIYKDSTATEEITAYIG